SAAQIPPPRDGGGPNTPTRVADAGSPASAGNPIKEAQSVTQKALTGMTPDMSGKLGLDAVIARINQGPGSPGAKVLAIEMASKHMAPEERHKWELYKLEN